jgi:predicted Zn-dependent protease with MMP-like domain
MISKTEFRAIIDEAISTLPETFQQALNNIAIIVEDWPDDKIMREMEIDHREDLLGLFHGSSLVEADEDTTGSLPNYITLYYRPLLLTADSVNEIRAEIRVTLLHELGHYFGLNEDRLSELGYD